MTGPPQQAPGAGDITRCYTWPESPGTAQVQCWNESGRQIQCCGHGLLSCAHLWTRRWGRGGILRYGESKVICNSGEGKSWIGFATTDIVHCSVPPWLPEVLGTPVKACAQAGAADGYLVVELSSAAQLRSMTAPGEALAARTRRALIISCCVPEETARHGEDIQLRYFAPQYGQPEDSATGSAMRVLAPFWQQRGQGTRLKALQCSATGGLLHSRLDGGRTWVGGHLAALDKEVALGA